MNWYSHWYTTDCQQTLNRAASAHRTGTRNALKRRETHRAAQDCGTGWGDVPGYLWACWRGPARVGCMPRHKARANAAWLHFHRLQRCSANGSAGIARRSACRRPLPPPGCRLWRAAGSRGRRACALSRDARRAAGPGHRPIHLIPY